MIVRVSQTEEFKYVWAPGGVGFFKQNYKSSEIFFLFLSALEKHSL